MPMRPVQSQSEFLVNQNQNISQLARGDKGGSIARSSQDWELSRPTDGLNAPVEGASPAQAPTDIVDWQFHTEAELKGSWQGVSPQPADFHPSELNFAMRQSSPEVNLTQAYKVDLSPLDTTLGTPPGEARHSLQLGAEFKDTQGQAWLALQGGVQSGQAGSTQLDASMHPLAGLEFSSGVTRNEQQSESRQGFKYSTQAFDQALELSASQQDTLAPESSTRQTQLGIKYADLSLASQEKSNQSAGGVTSDSSLDWGYAGKPSESLNLNAAWHEQISRFLDLGGSLQSQQRLQRASLGFDLQATPATSLNFGYTQETSPDQADPALQRQTDLRLGLSHKLTPAQTLGFNYSAGLQLHTYDLHYQYQQQDEALDIDKHFNLDLHREKNLSSPEQNLDRMTAEYATNCFNNQSLGFESRLSYARQAGLGTWEGQIRVFGQGRDALPLEMIARRNADQTSQLQVNYAADF